MRVRTIKNRLGKKLDDWLESIDDDYLRELVRENSIITGGAIASLLLNERVNDYDVYFADFETTKSVAEYYVEEFMAERSKLSGLTGPAEHASRIRVTVEAGRVKIYVPSAGIASEAGDMEDYAYFEQDEDQERAEQFAEVVVGIVDTLDDDEKPKYRPVFLSPNVITLSGGVQLVLRFYGNPDKIHENYDFVHCTNYWRSKDRQLVLRQEALASLLSKELIYQGSKYPVCSIFRLRKFFERGWSATAGQLLKICLQVSALDLTDLSVLEDQLIGVDVAYFMEAIRLLREDPEKRKAVTVDEAGVARVNTSYLLELLDRMF